MRKAVIFYSRADENYFGGVYRYIEVGNTEKIAKMIADVTGADLIKLEQKNPYPKEYMSCIDAAKKDKQANARPELVSMPDISGYDAIYLGYPNYWGTMPMAVYTFLESADFTGKIIHPFCTHEGSGLSGTEKDIANAAKSAKVTKGLSIVGTNVDKASDIVKGWI